MWYLAKQMKKTTITKKHFSLFFKSAFWFFVGIFLGLFFTLSFSFIFFQKIYGNSVFPGVYVNGVNFGGKTEKEVTQYFDNQNAQIADTSFTFQYNEDIATISAAKLNAGFNSQLLAHQAFLIGRSNFVLSDIFLVYKAFLDGVFLPPSYSYSEDKLTNLLQPIIKKNYIEPVDALFTFSNNRVTAFKPSSDGQEVNTDKIKDTLQQKIPVIISQKIPQNVVINLPIAALKPKVSTGDANNLGIKELIGTGTSLFQHSIPSRVFNVNLAASRINGVLISPNEVFSFDKALGDVSKFTGYQQAYVISQGHTVLGDGGGVCQVSTTFFRAALSAGLPIVERHAHDYRVGYYEEDGPPGIDATVYVPSVDLKIKNDTGHYILVQSIVDLDTLRLTFNFYGTDDGRKVSMTTPIVKNVIPAPPPLYNDDPNLPQGQVIQTDFAANGATVSFARTVTKGGQTLDSDLFVSNYRPWQAVFTRGTK